ncbi:PREDICTED: eukaryotic translation initiation factor 4E-1-like [Fragaria vesca subsp. vesca]
MASFSTLRGSAEWVKEEVAALLRRDPTIPYKVATTIAYELFGFPYIILPEVPAIVTSRSCGGCQHGRSMYNNMHHPSKLTPGYDFYLFKENIEPKWEDPVCATGGKWTMTFSNGESDRSWMDMLQALVKEEFKHRDEICGAVVNVRNGQESIALWTKNATNEAAQVSIGKQWKGFLDSKETIVFTIHDDASQVGSTATNLYTV